MKGYKILFLLVLLLSTVTASSQWNPCLGIEGGMIVDIILHDTSIYIIGSGNGVFKKGVTELVWSEKILHGNFRKIRSTSTGLFCNYFTKLYRSLDHGETWDQPLLQSYIYVYDLETSDSAVFIVGYFEVLRSKDQGETWTDINPFPNAEASELKLYANDNWIFCTGNRMDSVSFSSDHGDTWTKIPMFDAVGYIGDVYKVDDEIWMSYRPIPGNSFDKIYVYDLEAGSWLSRNDSIPAGTDVTTFFTRDNLLRCATGKGIYHFDRQGLIWVSDNNTGLEDEYLSAVCVKGDSTWVATPSGPFFNPGNADWLPDYKNLHLRQVSQVFRNGVRIYALSEDKIYYSDSIEAGFDVLNTQGLNIAYEIIITDSAWYAGSSDGFLISVDSGYSWISHSQGLEGKAARYIAITSEYFFCTNGGVFRTRKDSIAWERVPNNLGNKNVWGVRSLNDVLFANVYMEGLYRSADHGTTFQHVPESGSSTKRIHVEDQSIYMLEPYGPILSTSGNCVQWENYISSFQDNARLYCMDVSDSGNSVIIGGGKHIISLVDNYLEFFEDPQTGLGIDIKDNLPISTYPLIRTVYNDNGRLFASPNSNGLFYRDDFLVKIENDPVVKIADNSIIQIYPNPASDRMIINGPAKDDIIHVKFFNSLGQSLLSLNKSNEYIIDVSDFKAGLYILEINLGYRMIRKKIMII